MAVAVMGAELELARHMSVEGIEQIQRALPEGVSLARFDTALATAMLTLPDLQKCDRTSLFLALVKCAQRGLLPDGKQAAIVPFNNKRKGIVEATFIEMIDGTRLQFARHGWLLAASVVYAADAFAIDKGDGRVRHEPALTGDRGPVIGAWAKATHRDGRRRAADYMPIEEIHALRDQMGVGGRELWQKWPNQAAEKTVAHRLANDVGLADEDRDRSVVIDATELGPEESAAALYGEPARATFSELPSGVQPADATAAAGDDSTDAPPVPGDVTPGGSSEPNPAAVSLPQPDDEQLALAADAAEYVPPTGRYADGGEEGPLDLAAILDLGEVGRKYLDTMLRRATDPVYRQQLDAFARVHMPAEFAAAQAAKSKAA